MAVGQMNIANQLSAAARCSSCGQIIGRNFGGRPIVPTSRRQAVLAYLDEVGRATSREISNYLGSDKWKLYCTIQDLKSEGKIRKAGVSGRMILWELND